MKLQGGDCGPTLPEPEASLAKAATKESGRLSFATKSETEKQLHSQP